MTKSYMMNLLTAAAISGLVSTATPSSAMPLATGLIGGNSAAPIKSGLMEKAYYKRYHRHAYYRYRHHRHHHYYYAYYPHYYYGSPYYCDDYYGGYYGDCGYPYGYGYPAFPFVGFGFGFGGHHHHHGHW